MTDTLAHPHRIPRPLDRRPVPAVFRTYAQCKCGWVRDFTSGHSALAASCAITRAEIAVYGHRRAGKHIGPMGKAGIA